MEKVTVLIPTLNSISYMKECLESVRNQTLSDLEILVIDAGSTDGTLELLEQYQVVDNRIHIIHSEKKSYGYQLNKGINLAKGKYIGIVESDDVIEPDMYEELFAVAEKEGVDFAKGNFANYAITENNQEMIIKDASVSKSIMGKAMKPSDYKNIYLEDFYLWRGIYSKKFLEDNQIKFNESPGAAYQDIGFLYQTFTLAQKVLYLDKCFYKYRRNNSNSSTYSSKAFSYLAGEYNYVVNHLIENDELHDQWSEFLYQKMFIQCRSRIRLLAFHEQNIDTVKKDIMYLQNLLIQAFSNHRINLSVWDMSSQMEFFMFTKDIFAYIEYYKTQIMAKKHCINNMIGNLKRFSEIVLVCDGKALPFVYTLLLDNKIDTIVNVCDNDSTKWGKNRMGLRIISVEQACESSWNKAYVIFSPRAKIELIQQLHSLGISDEHIYSYDMGCEWLFLPQK